MASTPEGDAATAAYRLQMLAIKARAVKALMTIWPDLDWVQFEKVWPAWVSYAYRICAENRRGAALLTASYLTVHRLAEGVPGEVVPVLADALDQAMFETSLNATARKALMDAAYKASTIDDPALRRQVLREARRSAIDQAAGAFARHALNGGRETTEQTMRRDSRVQGWARVTDGDPCYFCAMLAGRGPVYRSKAAAIGASRYHDMCGCTAELVYDRHTYRQTGNADEYARLWSEVAAGLTGSRDGRYRGNYALQAFRKAFEQAHPAA